MKIRWLVLVIAGIAGFALLAIPKKEPVAKDAVEPDNPRTRSDHVRNEEDARWEGFVARAKSIPFDRKLQADFLAELAPEDRLKAFQKLAGLGGKGKKVPSQVEELLAKMVGIWAAEDFDGAWKAVGNLEDESLARRLKGAALDALAKSDIERACELHLTEAAADKWFHSEVPHRMLAGKLGENAEGYVLWMEKLGYPDVGGNDFGKFAKDFDFQMAADHAAAQTAIDGKPNKSLPVNFLHIWAKKDPDAAFAWWSSNKLAYCGLNGIAEALEERSAGSATAWLAERLPESGPAREAFLQGLGGTHYGKHKFKFETLAAAMPDSQAADGFLTDFLLANPGSPSYVTAIGAMSSPEARLEALRELGRTRPELTMAAATDEKLQEWGISRDSLREIFPASGSK